MMSVTAHLQIFWLVASQDLSTPRQSSLAIEDTVGKRYHSLVTVATAVRVFLECSVTEKLNLPSHLYYLSCREGTASLLNCSSVVLSRLDIYRGKHNNK